MVQLNPLRSLVAFHPPPWFHHLPPLPLSTTRSFHPSPQPRSHENPLNLPPPRSSSTSGPPSSARPSLRQAPPPLPKKRPIPGVKHVIVVSSGKGGVGKSTIATNLAVALSQQRVALSNSSDPDLDSDSGSSPTRPLKIGILDLDIFGPSIPKLFNLEHADPPELTRGGNKLIPLRNHGVRTMSVGYLLPPSANNDSPIAWRGMMVMKAVQQLLFDVDWREGAEGRSQAVAPSMSGGVGGGARGIERGDELDVLVVDMPPGTGDVQLSLGQLVIVDGAIIVSTPQSVSLIDARKGVNMFRKLDIPIVGAVLNQSHYACECCGERRELFGSGEAFEGVAREMGMEVVGKIPLVPTISTGGDAGLPIMAEAEPDSAGLDAKGHGWKETRQAFEGLAKRVVRHLGMT